MTTPTDQRPPWYDLAQTALTAAVDNDPDTTAIAINAIADIHGATAIPEVLQAIIDTTLETAYGVTEHVGATSLSFEQNEDVDPAVTWSGLMIQARASGNHTQWATLINNAGQAGNSTWTRNVWALFGVCATAIRARDDLAAIREANARAQKHQRATSAHQFTTNSGHTLRSRPIDPRDASPDDQHLLEPHGNALYAVAVYTAGNRDAAATDMHSNMESFARQHGFTLCPVRHTEDVEIEQILHSSRAEVRVALAAAQEATGAPGILMRGWRHPRACPGTSTAGTAR